MRDRLLLLFVLFYAVALIALCVFAAVLDGVCC